MANRRPLTLVNGRIKELPTADAVIGVPMFLRVGLRSGATFPVPLTPAYMLTIGLRAGGTFNIQATT